MSHANAKRRHLFLIGYRGSGKTTLGRSLAHALHRPFIDTDHWIEERSGCTIPVLFAQQGEPAFRDWESLALQFVCDATTPDSVVSLGGGAILRERHRTWIREHGLAIWLVASPAALMQRIERDASAGKHRPSLTAQGTLQEIESVLAQREPLYRETADWVLEVEHEPLQKLVERVLSWLAQTAPGAV